MCNDGVRLDLEKFLPPSTGSSGTRLGNSTAGIETPFAPSSPFAPVPEVPVLPPGWDLKFVVLVLKSSCRDNAVGRAFVREAEALDERTRISGQQEGAT